LVVLIVSRPLFFLLLLSVAFLTAAAGFQSGGARLGGSGKSLCRQASEEIGSIPEDASRVGTRLAQVPRELWNLSTAAGRDVKTIEADAAADISRLFRTT
jgi:hypothetical protein